MESKSGLTRRDVLKSLGVGLVGLAGLGTGGCVREIVYEEIGSMPKSRIVNWEDLKSVKRNTSNVSFVADTGVNYSYRRIGKLWKSAKKTWEDGYDVCVDACLLRAYLLEPEYDPQIIVLRKDDESLPGHAINLLEKKGAWPRFGLMDYSFLVDPEIDNPRIMQYSNINSALKFFNAAHSPEHNYTKFKRFILPNSPKDKGWFDWRESPDNLAIHLEDFLKKTEWTRI